MRNFVILFQGKEGTSPLVRLLNNFEQISIVHHSDKYGWEPFDRHTVGSMSLKNLERCLEIVFGKSPIDFKRLNKIYTRTAIGAIEQFSGHEVVGFKMRFRPPTTGPWLLASFATWNQWWKKYTRQSYKRRMINLFKRHDVVPFLAVRQDVFRWGLSKYHGDGTGKAGHLQFKLASNQISRDEIGKIHVNLASLDKIITRCEKSHSDKRRLAEDFERAGIKTYPLRYEDFLTDKANFLRKFFDVLELEISDEEIDAAIQKGEYFKKVHSDDISDFVENHEEVEARFGDRLVSWR